MIMRISSVMLQLAMLQLWLQHCALCTPYTYKLFGLQSVQVSSVAVAAYRSAQTKIDKRRCTASI